MTAPRLVLFTAIALLATAGLTHETQTVGDGQTSYDVIVGFTTEPPFTGERNGLGLTVRQTEGGEPVENLQNSLSAQLIAPDGQASLDLELRARHGQLGAYTADFVLTEPGVYTLRLEGFIAAVEVDLTFELHEVRPFGELHFP